MSKTRIISPGSIPNHKLLKNLQLQGNYISNDGGDEGIAIDDDGIVTVGPNQLTIDRNITSTSDASYKGLVIDIDKTGTSTGTNSIYGIDIDVDNTTATDGFNSMFGIAVATTLQHAADEGIALNTGINVAIDGDGSGTSVGIGMKLNVSGHDTNNGLLVDAEAITSKDYDIKCIGSSLDYFQIRCSTNGRTTLTTHDNAAEAADLILNIDGYVDINSASGEDITLDSGGDIILDSVDGVFKFYKDGDTDDLCSLTVSANGRTTITTADSDGVVGHLDFAVDGHIDFNTSGCGFTQIEVTFGESPVIEDSGNSTDIDFRRGNKAWLELTGNLGALNNINLIFPDVSGNFVLVLEQDGTGSRTIHADAWEGNMYTSDGSTPATMANPLWAGGTAPTLTTTADYFDIISFYWDATNERVFAVPTLNFS